MICADIINPKTRRPAFWQKKRAAMARLRFRLERETGIEPACSAWEADALPVSYSRIRQRILCDFGIFFLVPSPRIGLRTEPYHGSMMPFHQEGIVFGDPRWIRTSVPCVRGRNTRPLYERTTRRIG
jgi:hypothetical protein